MSEKLHFSLVSPERELYAGEVDHVICPGTDGEFGVLPLHAPFMSTLKTGVVRVLIGDTVERIFVRGGFADVTPDGLTVLAEEALDLSDVNADDVARQLAAAKAHLQVASSDHSRHAAEFEVERLSALLAAATGKSGAELAGAH